jgi:signal transduction histidine kinase
VPWSPRAWAQAIYLAGGIPALLVAPAILFALILATTAQTVGIERILPLAWAAGVLAIFLLSPALTRVHRHRLRVTAGVEIPPQPKWRGPLTWQGLTAVARSQATWRQLCYHVLVAPVLAAAAIVAAGAWPASVACTLAGAVAWAGHQPGQPPHGGLFVFLTFVGVFGLFLAPWLTSGVRALDIRAARALLGPSRADELEHRVEQLTETRAGVVDAADAERRRLERDLHDGTQQRLVSLAINLGMARAQAGSAEQA